MTTFRSKLGREIIIPIAIILVGLGSLMVYQKIWEGLTVIACVGIFIIFIFSTTYYQIDGRILKIRCGISYILKIDIDTIRRMSETNNPISSPAFSLDRLEIKYQKEQKIDTIMISPKDKDGFIKLITQLNPTIEIRLKLLN